MNNVNVANMNAMAGAVGGAPMPMAMNNANGPMAAAQQAAQRIDNTGNNRVMLNTYIYDYFLREGLFDCARALLTSDQPPNVNKGSPGSRRDENGNVLGNGVGDDAMDTDSKEDIDSKRPSDLPLPILSAQSETCFLYEWFCLFWDMLMSQRKMGSGNNPPNAQVSQYIQHAQLQNRQKQNHQQEIARQMRSDGTVMGFNPMLRNGMAMKQQNTLARAAMGAAMASNQNNPNMQMVPQKQGQMQRDPSDMDGSRRPASPGSAENAPSPNKRPRLEGNTPFNPQQAPMMPNGRPQQGMPGQQVSHKTPSSPATLHAQQSLLAYDVLPYSLMSQQFYQNQQQPVNNQQKIASYQSNINKHHVQQINNGMGGNAVPQGQGSPIMPNQPNGAEINTYYNAEGMGGGGIRAGPGNGQGSGSNHALQDYQMQLMLLEQQNKKRLMMARQEQDSMGGAGMPRGDGPGGPQGPPGANGQPFPDASPQGARAGASPNPSEQMKRGTPQMNPAGIPSPLPEGAQSRGSPNPMNFMPNGMDPNMAPHFFKGNMNGMEGNMVQPGMNGGMRPPSSHPGQPFNGQMNPQMMAARQAQAQQQQQQGGPGGPQMQWQAGPNGANPMVQQQQGPQGPVQGTPQQRAMPPPSAPGPGGNANARTQPSSPAVSNAAPPTPQQGNKPNPKKKDSKAAKNKAAAQKKANNNTGATPAAEPSQEPEPPTPATPITPVNPGNFAKTGGPNAAAGQQVPNTQQTSAPPAQVPVALPAQSDHQMHPFGSIGDFNDNLGFADPSITNDVLNDFDFDSFLHDGENDNGGFDFSGGAFGIEGGEIGATD